MKSSFFLAPVFLALALAVFSAPDSKAFYPKPSQLARVQTSLLEKLPPYSSTGSLQFKETSMPYELVWFNPRHYRVVIKGIPGKLYANGSGPSNWILHRNKTQCLITAEQLKVNCPSPKAWALLELSGSPEDAAQGLYHAGLIELEDIPLGQTDSAMLNESKENRVALVIESNGKHPAALLSLQGLEAQESAEGEIYPELLMDQTFLAPTRLRLKNKAELFTIKAQSDLEIRRGHGRTSYILAQVLDVESELKLRSTFRRTDPKFSHSHKAPPIGKSMLQVDSLQSLLNVEGQFLLESLLMTH